ncbi:MAG: YgaP-like transmembrane domain [Planctomycetota bacterium]
MCPNIDRKGRIARAITGSLCIAFGVVCWVAGWPEAAGYRWIIILPALAAGGFQLFEARNSWCVMRACGIKTPV